VRLVLGVTPPPHGPHPAPAAPPLPLPSPPNPQDRWYAIARKIISPPPGAAASAVPHYGISKVVPSPVAEAFAADEMPGARARARLLARRARARAQVAARLSHAPCRPHARPCPHPLAPPPAPSPPPPPLGVKRIDEFYSCWACRTVPSPWPSPDGGAPPPACETILLHHDNMKVPESLARVAIRTGMWKFLRAMVAATKPWVAARRGRVDPFSDDPDAACRRATGGADGRRPALAVIYGASGTEAHEPAAPAEGTAAIHPHAHTPSQLHAVATAPGELSGLAAARPPPVRAPAPAKPAALSPQPESPATPPARPPQAAAPAPADSRASTPLGRGLPPSEALACAAARLPRSASGLLGGRAPGARAGGLHPSLSDPGLYRPPKTADEGTQTAASAWGRGAARGGGGGGTSALWGGLAKSVAAGAAAGVSALLLARALEGGGGSGGSSGGARGSRTAARGVHGASAAPAEDEDASNLLRRRSPAAVPAQRVTAWPGGVTVRAL
jgi:hypothetical protein